ncbi:MAG: DMT family transporter [Bacteroidota bacterium]
MKTKNAVQGLWMIHLATLLFGFSGLFGKWVEMSALWLVLGRTFFAGCSLFSFLAFRHSWTLPKGKKQIQLVLMSGALLGVHWMAFFGAIQKSNVALGLLTFSTFPMFTSLLEPLVFREKIKLSSLILSLLILLGVVLVGWEGLQQDIPMLAVGMGLFAGFSFAVLSLLNRNLLATYSGLQLTAWETLIAFVTLLPFAILFPSPWTWTDVGLTFILGLIFTGVAHSLFIESIYHLNAQTTSLIVSLEPVYGIFAAWLLLKEIPSILTIGGGILILGAGLWPTFMTQKSESSTVN